MIEVNIVTFFLILPGAFVLFALVEGGVHLLARKAKLPVLAAIPAAIVLIYGIWSCLDFFNIGPDHIWMAYPELFWERGFLPMRSSFYGMVFSASALLGCLLGYLVTIRRKQ